MQRHRVGHRLVRRGGCSAASAIRPGSRPRLALGVVAVLVTVLAAGVVGLTQSRAASLRPARHEANVVAIAKAAVARYVAIQRKWDGPTSGPKAKSGEKIVFISCGSFNQICVQIGKDVAAVAAKLGWKDTTIDGQGTPSGWLHAFNEAIALHPDGIIDMAVTASAVRAPLQRAQSLHIPVVGVLAANSGGPDPKEGLFYNASQQPSELGQAAAYYAIAESNGTARVVLAYDDLYAIARTKDQAYLATLKKCSGCKVLANVETPFANIATNGPALAQGWAQRYGPKPFWVISVGDVAYDSMVPALRSANVPPAEVKMIGADGFPSAYQRIRAGDQYQVATLPQPDEELGYEAIDQLNRAMQHKPPFIWNPSPYLVVHANVDTQGGDKNVFDPPNDYAAHYLKIWGAK